jgi:hypothetical protein
MAQWHAPSPMSLPWFCAVALRDRTRLALPARLLTLTVWEATHGDH